MSDYDGSIKIDTKIDTKNVSSQMLRLENQISKAARKASELTEKMRQMENAKIPTEDYKYISDALHKSTAEFDKLLQRQQEMIARGKTSGAAWDSLDRKIEEVGADIRAAEKYQSQMVKEGTAYLDKGAIRASDAYQKLKNHLRDTNGQMQTLAKKQEELAAKENKVANSANRARRSTGSWLDSFSNKTKRTSGLLHNFATRLKGIALSMFIFNWITKGWNAMLSAIKDGAQNMAKYSSDVNAKMSQLTSAVATLKNAFGALAAPIISAVGPALTWFINLITAAINKVNQFISALIGKSTWTKATTQVKDYAAGLDKAANSAKKLKGQLQSFDELNNLNSNDSGGSDGSGGSGGNVSDMFEEVPIDQNIADLANEIKNAIESGDWEGLGELVGNKIKSALDSIDWDKVYAAAITFGSGLALFLNGLISPELFGSVGSTIAGALNTALNFLNSFGHTFSWTNFGDSIAQGINDFFSTFDWKLAADTFNTLAHGIVTAASEAISGTDWTAIGQDIGTLLAGIDWIGLLSDVGKLIWEAIKAAVETWKGMFDKAPIETAIFTAMSLLKLTGVGSLVTGKIADVVGSALKSKGLSLGKIAFGLGMAGTTVFLMDSDDKVASIIGAPITAFLAGYTFTGNVKLSLKIAAPVLAADAGLTIGQAIGDAIADATQPEEMEKYRVTFTWSDLFSYSWDDWKQGFSDWWNDTWGPGFDEFWKDNMSGDFKFKIPFTSIELPSHNEMGKAINNWLKKEKKNIEKKLDNIVQITTEVKDTSSKWWSDVKKYWSEKVGKVKDFTTNVKNNAKDWWKNTKTWWSEKVGKVESFTTGVKNKASEWWSSVKKWWENTTAGKEVKKFTANVKKAGGTWWKDVSNDWKEKVVNAGKTLKIGISFAKNALSNLWSSVTGFFGGKTVNVSTKATKKADGGIYTGGMWHNITKYALGTENAPTGQVFIAREAGPELVGTIGGHTSVVNNDQIVASVSDGVARAVRSVIGTNGSNVNVTFKVEGDPNGIFRVTQQKANEYFRATGNPAFEM